MLVLGANQTILRRAAGVLGALILLSGCLTQPSPEPDTAGDDDLTSQASVMCGQGRAVTGVDSDGQVKCGSVKLSGQAAETDELGNPSCEDNQDEEWLVVNGRYGQIGVPTCTDKEDNESDRDDVTFGTAPTGPFSCPKGSALKGFTDFGEPVCATLVGDDLLDAVLAMPSGRCPWGMLVGEFDFGDFAIPFCVYSQASPKQIKLIDQRVTKFPRQNGRVCSLGKVAVGFTEDHRVICRRINPASSRAPRRYFTNRFEGGHPERPLCRSGYVAKAIYLRWVQVVRSPVKIWTCARRD